MNCPILGLAMDPERDERRVEKLSFRKQLKLKCQEQQTLAAVHDKALGRVETNVTAYQPMAVVNHIPPSKNSIYFFYNELLLRHPCLLLRVLDHDL